MLSWVLLGETIWNLRKIQARCQEQDDLLDNAMDQVQSSELIASQIYSSEMLAMCFHILVL